MNFDIKYPDPDRLDFRDYMMSYRDVKEFSRWKTGYSSQLARKHWLTVGKYESRNIKFKRVNYSIVESYIREHIPVIYSGEKINLVTSLYCEQNEKRLEEYRLSLKLNISNPMIESIVVFYEPKNGEKFEDVYPTSSKVSIINCDQRPSFGEIFDYTNKNPGLTAIVNADIVLTDDFRLINKIDLTNRIFALTRWQFVSENDIGIFHIYEKPNKYSQDTWVYRTPMKYPKILKEVRLGEVLCDSNLSYHFSRSGTSVLNPCHDIKTFHIHFQNSRTQSYENLSDAKEKKFDGGFPDNWPESNLCLLEDLL